MAIAVAEMVVRAPETEQEWEQYYQLRWQILRQPWQQPVGSEKDEMETLAIHRVVLINQQIIAVGRLHFSDESTAQIRYMAVHPEFQNHGVGKKLIESLESAAIEHQIKTIVLHARENAVEFYRHCGYQLLATSHLLYNAIQHYQMQKLLKGN